MKNPVVIAAMALLCAWAAPAHAFTHPGIPLTTADIAFLKANLNTEPWKSGYAALVGDGHSSLDYKMLGPFQHVNRNFYNTYDHEWEWKSDMQAVFNLAMMWAFTGDARYAKKSHDILLAWAKTQTKFNGIEAPFDLGDYVYCYAGGADILRGTWSGWTTNDTTTVQNYFRKVLCPESPGLSGSGSQGMEGLLAELGVAVFCDDTASFNAIASLTVTDGDTGLRDTLANGEVGDTGRDQGHTSLYINNLALIGEIFWKQGVDLFSAWDNRILACGEYDARFNMPGPTPPFVSFGTPFWGPFTTIGGEPRSCGPSRRAMNILLAAYAVRKGISAPWCELYANDLNEDGNSFLFRKSADPSTAAPLVIPTFPPMASQTKGLTNADLNGSTPAGSGVYDNGTWSLTGGYGDKDPWTSALGNDSVHFAYKQIEGDFTMVAKVTSVTGTEGAKAGIMARDALGNATYRSWVAITPKPNCERAIRGWSSLPYGSNAQSMGFGISKIPYWVKMERVGDRIQTFVSQTGGDWSPACVADFKGLPSTLYVGLFDTSFATGTSNSATFTNVCLTGGDGGNVTTPAAPFSVLAAGADSRVQLRWNESFGATGYKVKRSTASGSGYVPIATVSNTTYTDTTAVNGTTYYYVVSAVNSKGESANSPQDSAKPIASLVNVAFGGSPNDSAGKSGGDEGAAKAFDENPGTKWLGPAVSWLQYDFGENNAQTIKRYAITSGNDVPERDPKSWKFQGSNDGTTWTTLDSRTNQASFPYRSQTISYDIATPHPYRFYRLNVTANNGDANTQLSELALLTDTGRLVPDGTCCFSNRRSNKALNVGAGGSVRQWSYCGYGNQKWKLKYLGDGQYQILALAGGDALDVSNRSPANGATLDITPWNGGTSQRWILTPSGDGFFKLTAAHSGKVASVTSTTNGGNVIQWPYVDSPNQQWSISNAP